MPKVQDKHPQNMHNLLELLFVDLEIWVNSKTLPLFFGSCFVDEH